MPMAMTMGTQINSDPQGGQQGPMQMQGGQMMLQQQQQQSRSKPNGSPSLVQMGSGRSLSPGVMSIQQQQQMRAMMGQNGTNVIVAGGGNNNPNNSVNPNVSIRQINPGVVISSQGQQQQQQQQQMMGSANPSMRIQSFQSIAMNHPHLSSIGHFNPLSALSSVSPSSSSSAASLSLSSNPSPSPSPSQNSGLQSQSTDTNMSLSLPGLSLCLFPSLWTLF